MPTVEVNTPTGSLLTLKTSELAVLPQTTLTVSSGGATTTESGPTLASLLTLAGVQYNAACKNDELRWWIEATNAQGSAVTLTAGETDPGFGNRPAILSIDENGRFLTSSGPRLDRPERLGRTRSPARQHHHGGPRRTAARGCDPGVCRHEPRHRAAPGVAHDQR